MFVRNLFYKTLFLFISSFLILLSCANITQAQNAPKDQRGLDKTITTTTDGKNVTLTNTGKYGVPAESLTDLGLRGTRFMIYEDSSGKAYYTRTGVSSENDFKSFSQLYNSDGIGVFRIMNNGGGPYQAGNNEALELLEDGSGDPQSYAPSKKATAQNTDGSTKTTGITQDGITFLNTNISGNDANHPIVTTTEKSSNGPTYINDGTKICGPDRCTYTLMAPIGSLLGDSKGQYIINKNDQRGLCSLLNSWFRIGIALAGMLAVVMIVLGGFQYATTDSLFDKEEGKGKIQNALWGLLLALTTWLVVSTINPALANCTINAKEVKLSAMSTQIYNSGALGGGAIGVGMTMADMALQAAGGGTGGGKTQSQIDYEYDQVYSQFTEQDYQDLADGKAEAKAKWEDIQTQLDALNNSFANSNKVSASGMAGSASSDAITAANEAFAKYGSAASNQRYMGVMDYSKSSSEPRFMIIDRETGKITYTQAAHGKGSDPNNTGYATNFSDVKGQNTSELGAFVATPYYSGSMGKNALSLDGLEDSNKNAGNTSNGKAIHTSDYVQNNGQQCGRSLGCIAVPNSMGDTALTKLSNAFIYSYYPQK